MLKVYGNLYSNDKEKFEEVADALRAAGYQIAYNNENSGEVLKEVNNLEEQE